MAIGKFYYLEGNQDLAREFLQKAYQQTNAPKEKEFIQHMLDKI
jgi:RNA polymerase sigma-70 factor (ECF subfamily)